MKLTGIILLAVTMHVSAASFAQKITISTKNSSLREVLNELRIKNNYYFIYNNKVIEKAKPVTVDLNCANIDYALSEIFKHQDLIYEIKENIIVVSSERKALTKKVLIDVFGIVSDENGLPIPGVSVKVKGTKRVAITNHQGAFKIEADSEKDILVFSYVGYNQLEKEAGNGKTINVTLKPKDSDLDEVVVVAYGQQKKITVTGAVSTITTKDLKYSSSATLAAALAGRLPGLTAMQSGGGQPGRDDITLYLRGASTTNGKNPLILIDGVPRDNIRTLDANEVESVSILKDAGATAVFGVRGANGVILITTKRGFDGQMELNINADQSYSSFTREPERLTSLEYMTLRNEAAANDKIATPPFSEAVMNKYKDPLQGLDPSAPDYEDKARIRRYMYPNHDYYRELISRFAPQTRVNANVRGGADKISYFANAVFLHQGGNLKTEPQSVLGYDPSAMMDRYNFRANLDYKITKSLKSFLNIGSYIEKVNMPAAWVYGDDTDWMMSDLIYQAQTILPITPGPVTIPGFGITPGQLVDPDYLDRSAFEVMNRSGYRNEVRSNLNSTLGLDWDLGQLVTRGLSIKGMISYDSKSGTTTNGKVSQPLYLANINPLTDQLYYGVKRLGETRLSLSKSVNSRYNINMQASANYNRTFGTKHNVTGLFLGQRDYWESTGGDIPWNVIGMAARATYAYDNKYLADVNMGYNGSEQFAPTKRFGFFPAFSVGWVISNENFMKDNKFITSLKLRGSYGKVGSDALGTARFLYQDNITVGNGGLGSLGNINDGNGVGQVINFGLLGNPYITWEEAKKQNYGIDIQLFKNLDITADYYIEKRTNILISRGTVPIFQGVALGNIPKVNMGAVDNKGYELEMTYRKSLNKSLSLMLKGMFAYNHNTVIAYDETIKDETYANRYSVTGYNLGQTRGYKIDYSNGNGYFNSQAELDEYLSRITYSFGKPRVGDFKYLDVNGDGVISDKDQVAIGYGSIPRVSYGFTLSLNYRNFEFMAFFQGVSKYRTNYASNGVYENTKLGTYFNYHKTAWTAERYAKGDEITYPALSTGSTTNHVANDFFTMDRSYIRLKNIEVAYTLPKNALKIIGVKNLRLYASGQNVFTWDVLKMQHLDPENNNSMGYPVVRMLNFGFSSNF